MITVIALVTMAIDHIGSTFFPDIVIFRIIGRLAFPLFAWGIARGYKYTKNYKRYAVRLLLLAILSQLPFYLVFKNNHINVCFTLLLGLMVLRIYDSKISLWIKGPSIIALMALSEYLKLEYGSYGILSIILFFHFWEKECIIYYYGGLTLVSTLVFHYDPIQLFAALSPFIVLYVTLLKKDFKLHKLFQYSFYPVHLLILFFLRNGGILK